MSEAETTTTTTTEKPGAGAADTTATSTTTASTTATTETTALTADTTTDVAASPQNWPDDWRERNARAIAGKDDAAYEKALARLKRFAAPENVVRSLFEADNKIRSGQYKRTLASDATAEEIAAYRKEMGIPETADGYELAIEGREFSDADKAVLGHFRSVFHEMNLPADTAKGIFGKYFEYETQAAAAKREHAREATINNRAAMKAEFGADYNRNLGLAKSYLDNVVGEEGRDALASMKLADGTSLGDHPAFVKMIVQAALNSGDDAAIARADIDTTGGSGSIEEQFNEAINLKFTDPKKYSSESHQARLMKLATLVEKAKSRAA